MNSLEMSVSNMDFVHALFSESRYPPLRFAVGVARCAFAFGTADAVVGCRAHCK